MLEVLLFIAIAVIGAQACIIALLVKLVNKTREEKASQIKQSRSFMKGLIKTLTEIQSELEDYKEAYHACHKEYSVLFIQNKTISKQLDELNKVHGQIVNNLMLCIQEGRVIKSKYLDKIVPYRFDSMTIEEISQFFGNIKIS